MNKEQLRKEGLKALNELKPSERDNAYRLLEISERYDLPLANVGEFASPRLSSILFSLRDCFGNNNFDKDELLHSVAKVDNYAFQNGIQFGQPDDRLDKESIYQLYLGMTEKEASQKVIDEKYKTEVMGYFIAQQMNGIIDNAIKENPEKSDSTEDNCSQTDELEGNNSQTDELED